MPDLGDALLYTVSAKGELSWEAFRSAYDSLRAHLRVSEAVAAEKEVFARNGTMEVLVELGHCDSDRWGRDTRIKVGPPILALLPSPGLPKAVLCGARAPQTLNDVRGHLSRFGDRAAVRVESQEAASGSAPALVEVEAASLGVLEELSSSLGIGSTTVPPAWQLAEFSGSLEAYLSSLSWKEEPEINWSRSDFCVEQVRFADGRSPQSLRLSRYRDPVRGSFRYYLWRARSTAEVDPHWGRFAVLAEAGRQVVEYDRSTFTLSVPRYLPLPRLLARALALCSGRPAAQPGVGRRAELEVVQKKEYRSVPSDVAGVVARKLGQRL